jgi:hypothetical protein
VKHAPREVRLGKVETRLGRECCAINIQREVRDQLFDLLTMAHRTRQVVGEQEPEPGIPGLGV